MSLNFFVRICSTITTTEKAKFNTLICINSGSILFVTSNLISYRNGQKEDNNISFISGEIEVQVWIATWLNSTLPKRPKPTTHHENHKNIIYYQYFSILEKAFSPSRNNLFVADSCSEVHRNKVLHIVEKNMLLLTDVLLFSPLRNMHLSAFESSDKRKRQVFNIFCNSINIFMISTHLIHLRKACEIPTGPRRLLLANIENKISTC